MTLKHLRSSTVNKRPQPSGMVDGQLAINTASGSPGLFFKDNAGGLVKIGPVHVGTTAPNASVASGGASGNTIGEQWLDTTGGVYSLKIWDGAVWRSEDGTFVNTAGDTMTGSLTMGSGTTIIFEGATDDGFETTLTVVDPTADNVVTLPNITGTVITTGDSGTVTSGIIASNTIIDANINANAAISLSKLATGALPTNITISSGNIVDGTITNADINASAAIVDTKLATISTSNKVGVTAINIAGATDVGSGLADADIFIVDVGATGTRRKAQAHRISTYTFAKVSGDLTIASGGTASIASGTIVDTDINASAAVAGTKISPNFGAQDIQTTGDIYAGNGTVSLPAFSFASNTNTGFYSHASGSVSLATTGALRWRVDNAGRMLIGSGTGGLSGSLALVVNRDYTGSADNAYIAAVPDVKSDVTTTARIYRSSPTLDSGGTFTLDRLVHYAATPGSFGSGNTVTDQFGFQASSSIIGATNNYGFRGDIPSGTSCWNFYAGTTADNYFNGGNFIIQRGATEAARFDASGRLLMGTSSAISALGFQAGAQFASQGGTTLFVRNSNDTAGTELNSIKSRGGSFAGATALTSGDTITIQRFAGYDGSTYTEAARVGYLVDGTVATGVMPGRIVFYTTSTASGAAVAERMRITSAGFVGINNTSPAFTLDVSGDAKISGSGNTVFQIAKTTTGGETRLTYDNTTDSKRGQVRFNWAAQTWGAFEIYYPTNTANGQAIGLQMGSDGTIFYSTTTSDTERARIDSNGYFLIGKSSSAAYGQVTGKLQVVGTSDAHISLKRSSTDTSEPVFAFAKSRGTDGSPTSIANGDNLGAIRFAGYDGSSYSTVGASISVAVDGTVASGIVPSRINVATTDASGNLSTVWRATNDSVVCYAQPAPATVNASSTLTIANLKTGIIQSTPASGITLTLPSGGLVEGGFNAMFTNQAFEWSVINLSGTNAITIASGTTHTITGSATVAANVSARYVTRRTASNTFVSYRLC